MLRCLNSVITWLARLRNGRVRILWLVLGALLLVSALPIGLYHRQVLQLEPGKTCRHRARPANRTHAVAGPGNSILRSQSDAATHQRAANSGADRPDRQCRRLVAEPKVTRLLENFVDTNRNTFLYLTAVGRDGKGTSASQGNFRAEQDPFVAKALQRAFASMRLQSVKFRSDPLALAPTTARVRASPCR